MSTLTPTARIEPADEGTFTVWTDWSGVPLDRPLGTGFRASNKRNATRLAAAINAGAVWSDPEVRTDVNGKTYVDARSAVMARYLNADLKRLGY